MRSTFVEKILNAPAGSMVYIEPDIVLSHDNSARVRKIFEKSGGQALVNPERLFIVLDRKMTGTTDELIRDYNSIRDFMKEQEVEHFFDCDRGICHQVVADYLRGGNIIVGSDSHTCTAGAFNCFAVGVNKTRVADNHTALDVFLVDTAEEETNVVAGFTFVKNLTEHLDTCYG